MHPNDLRESSVGRGNRTAAIRSLNRRTRSSVSTKNYWDELPNRVREGRVVPILSNAMLGDRIFELLVQRFEERISIDGSETTADESDPDVESGKEPTMEEIRAEEWAQYLGYPLPEMNCLHRVATYNHINSNDSGSAKRRYLRFTKKMLLQWACSENHDIASQITDENVSDLEAEHLLKWLEQDEQDIDSGAIERKLEQALNTTTFSQFALQLGLLPFQNSSQDGLLSLTSLSDLPIYITTSPHNFVEDALERAGRTKYRTQICFWNDTPPNVKDEHRFDRDFTPTAEEPVVYHLFGHEDYPETMVLSDDDYIDYIVRISKADTPAGQTIPLYLSRALASNTLLLLGYRLHDWDFRTLFRGLIHVIQRKDTQFNLAIQLKPGPEHGVTQVESATQYLEKYFAPTEFNVEWTDTDAFIQKLRQRWSEMRQ